MRVDVFPEHATPAPGQPVILTVQVFNSAPVISAHRIRILGVDEKWVTVDHDQLSLFPESTGVVIVTITLPAGIPSGMRRISIQVHELTPPNRTETVNVDLTIPAEQGARIAVDPISVSGGTRTTVGVMLANDGNTDLRLTLDAVDEEDKLTFEFDPPIVELSPGERITASARIKGRRPFAGGPKPRTYTVRALGTDPPLEAFGSFVQQPRISRGALGLIGLLAAVSVFAVVIAMSFAKVVDKSTADRDLLLQVIQGRKGGAVTNPGSLAGKVTLLTTGDPVKGVTVEAFDAGNTGAALITTATNDSGGYSITNLPKGSYKLRFQGAGFSELWFPSSLVPDNAKPIDLQPSQNATGLDVRLGGVPGKLTGRISGDAAGATVSLFLPGGAANNGSSSPSSTGAALTGAVTATTTPPLSSSLDAAGLGALVSSTTVAADGAFVLDKVPSPSAYDLVVQKEGFATEIQRVNLGAGEERAGIEILLRKGDGQIQGTIFGADGLLGGVTITATDGKATAATLSLTQDNVGAFTLRNLPTPSTLTLLVSKANFATQSLTLTLSPGQQLTGVVVTLSGGAGSISGTVFRAKDSTPAGGVSVQVSNGSITLQTVTLSVGAVGSYEVRGLPVPSTYTVTFSRGDLSSVTQAIDLDPFSNRDATGVSASLPDATGSVQGVVYEETIPAVPHTNTGVGEVDVTLSDGVSTFHTTSESQPSAFDSGDYIIPHVKPGTYTLTFNRRGAGLKAFIVSVVAGQTLTQNVAVDKPASISGTVLNTSAANAPLAGAQVRLILLSQYPGPPITTTLTNANGQFVFSDLVAPESYILEFAFPAGTSAQTTRTLFNIVAGTDTSTGNVLIAG